MRADQEIDALILTPEDIAQEAVQILHKKLVGHVLDCCVSLASQRPDDGGYIVLGTGFLVRVGGRPCLVSAGHVLDEGTKRGLPLWLRTADPLHSISVGGSVASYGGEADVGVVLLSESLAADIVSRGAGRFADSSCSLAVSPKDLPGARALYVVLGYPHELAETTNGICVHGLSYSGTLYKGGLALPSNYDESVHVLIDAMEPTALDGAPDAMPRSLGGISGCPIWMIRYDEVPCTNQSGGTPTSRGLLVFRLQSMGRSDERSAEPVGTWSKPCSSRQRRTLPSALASARLLGALTAH